VLKKRRKRRLQPRRIPQRRRILLNQLLMQLQLPTRRLIKLQRIRRKKLQKIRNQRRRKVLKKSQLMIMMFHGNYLKLRQMLQRPQRLRSKKLLPRR